MSEKALVPKERPHFWGNHHRSAMMVKGGKILEFRIFY